MSTPDNNKREYSLDEIIDLLEKAKDTGLALEKGSDLEKLTIEQLRVLVERKQ